ncbi:tail fiber domain-containing protein [Mesorhizobium sp. M1A.F.Ca.IN.020.04.1.1]|uniref:tail fiber domain-containing protein n=1 Tax=Mesorhizobium sp. M1A.F.Ca.IN.020.04.1.1 TaxID=2496761 RepID=UPI000FCC75C3|nr:tail fiber domain-containing protein [Mesorhizobium sp. M1A.F.Ca.IN.020.04.1.1]RUW04050.1 tail fiber domain-containing protein [Mesorhizobium sp. M1A.F.Ca.IN.020.04.1.1]RUW04113.1 tail fiber domain-containing protein [Mesorhizobium sp. M1A.F.Ca.IN.020.04.1.1]
MGSSTSSSQTSSPPKWAQPLFEKSATEAQNIYNSGAGGNTFSGPTVADLSGTTVSGINQLATAGANTNTAGTRPMFEGIGAASVSPSYSEQNLQNMANGSYLTSGNPYFNDALKGQLDQTAAQVQSQFSGAGRYGSGANTGVLTSQLGNIRSNALMNQFNQDTQNMLAANNQLDASRNAGLDRALSATNAMSGQDQQQFNNAITGANATLQAGGLLDTQAQKQLSDLVSQWYAQDNQDWTRLGLLQAAASGAAGDYGTQTGHSSSSNPLGALGAVGGLFGGK